MILIKSRLIIANKKKKKLIDVEFTLVDGDGAVLVDDADQELVSNVKVPETNLIFGLADADGAVIADGDGTELTN